MRTIATVIPMSPKPGVARCTDTRGRSVVRESVTLAEVPGFLAAVREARTMRPDIDARVFVELGKGRHTNYHPTRSVITTEVLLVFAEGLLSRGAA